MHNGRERAMYSLYKKSRSLNLPIDIQLNLFDKVVLPIMLYSCEVWGFSNLSPLESLHRKFCKMALKLRSSTPNIMIYGETGRFPLEVLVKIRMINFWSRIVLGKREKLSFIAYSICKSHLFDSGLETDWISYIHKILTSTGYTNWNHIEQFIAEHEVKLIGNDITTSYVTSWHEDLQNKPSCQSLYNHIKFVYGPEFYLKKLSESLRIPIAKFRTSNHRLPIQRGCYDGTAREERL